MVVYFSRLHTCVQSVVAFLDACVLRYARRMHVLLHLEANVDLDELHVDENETVDQVWRTAGCAATRVCLLLSATDARPISKETLLMDKRIVRDITCVSSDVIFITGTRFVCQWVSSHARKVDDHTPSAPAVCCVSPNGLLVLLPVQRLLVPLLWHELSGVAAKKDLLWVVQTPPSSSALTWWLRVVANAGSAAAMEAALKHEVGRAKSAHPVKAWPNSYPPPRAIGTTSTDLALPTPPQSASEAARREATLEALYEMRAHELTVAGPPEMLSRKVCNGYACVRACARCACGML